ncbi:MAG: replicative DNA helicase [Actinomycetota bacterium]|nr:replicative DNA helicase [Actinomycetota bacterium]MEE2646583.1 replicative DNA helicase [Actinomycetota bacterium]
MDDSTENMNFDDAPTPDSPPDDLLNELVPDTSFGQPNKNSTKQSLGSRIPPQALDVEAALLGTMLLSRDAIADALQIVEPSHFYKPSHIHVFEAICDLYGAGEPADVNTVGDSLNRRGYLEKMGGKSFLLELQAGSPSVTSAARYAKIVTEHATLRTLIGVGNEITEIGYSQPDDVVKAVDEAENLVFQVSQRRTTESMERIGPLLQGNLDRLEALADSTKDVIGTPTGFRDFDNLLSGLQDNSLIIVGGRPATGKTAFGLNIATNIAISGLPTLVFNMEMSQLELSQRILCSEARVDSRKVRNGQLNDQDWTRINQGLGMLDELQLYIDDNPNLSIMEIRGKARRLKSKVGKLGVIVVDYLQLMTGRSNAESRQVEVAEISRGLKILARELETPVIGLSQLSRGLEARQDKRPMLSDLRESGSIEQDADVVAFVYRDEVYNPESPDAGTAEIIVAKHRNGPTGTIRLGFLPHYTRFQDMARPDMAQTA